MLLMLHKLVRDGVQYGKDTLRSLNWTLNKAPYHLSLANDSKKSSMPPSRPNFPALRCLIADKQILKSRDEILDGSPGCHHQAKPMKLLQTKVYAENVELCDSRSVHCSGEHPNQVGSERSQICIYWRHPTQ